MVAFDADTVLTGSADGLIRIIGILPNAMLGLVGEHAQVRLSRSGGLDLASRHHLQPSSMHWQPARCQAVPVLESNAQMRQSWRWFEITASVSKSIRFIRTHAWHCCRQCHTCAQDLVERLALLAKCAWLACTAHSRTTMQMDSKAHTGKKPLRQQSKAAKQAGACRTRWSAWRSRQTARGWRA